MTSTELGESAKAEMASQQALSEETVFLERVSQTYVTSSSAQDKLMRRLAVRTFAPFIGHGRALELGCDDGTATELIAQLVDALDVVEGSERFLREAKKRNLQNVRFIHSLFENFESDSRYDFVFATYVLEHVLDPNRVLGMIRSVLQPDGLLFVVVPNANALSRHLAYHMGLVKDLKSLTQNDLNHGHRRVYDRVSLNRDLAEAGFTSISQGGILLKPLADFQMDKMIKVGILEEPQLNGFYSLGLEFPDLCGSLYSICKSH
jgi:2-polyprenyl-3-methyl-5-hydroxy-6-metoxy-1,4-benzoquinol methylase